MHLLERQISQGQDFTLLDLLLTNSKVLVTNLVREDTLSCSDHKMITVRIQRKGGKISIRHRTQDFRRANFSFCRELLGRIFLKNCHQRKDCPGEPLNF